MSSGPFTKQLILVVVPCCVQLAVVSGFLWLLAREASSVDEFEGRQSSTTWIVPPLATFWVVGAVFLSGLTIESWRDQFKGLWRASRVAVGLGSTFVLLGSTALVLVGVAQGASVDGWGIILCLAVSSGLTLAGVLRSGFDGKARR